MFNHSQVLERSSSRVHEKCWREVAFRVHNRLHRYNHRRTSMGNRIADNQHEGVDTWDIQDFHNKNSFFSELIYFFLKKNFLFFFF
jgi:hypothetical protein